MILTNVQTVDFSQILSLPLDSVRKNMPIPNYSCAATIVASYSHIVYEQVLKKQLQKTAIIKCSVQASL